MSIIESKLEWNLLKACYSIWRAKAVGRKLQHARFDSTCTHACYPSKGRGHLKHLKCSSSHNSVRGGWPTLNGKYLNFSIHLEYLPNCVPILFHHHYFQKIDRTLTKCYRQQNLLQNISTVNRANLSQQKQLQICRGSSTFVIYWFIDWVGSWPHILFHWNSCWQASLCQKCS